MVAPYSIVDLTKYGYRNTIINLELIFFFVNAPILKVLHPFQNTIKTLYMFGTIFGLCENEILDKKHIW